ncbi:MAG: DUF1080 domain-containing protein [Bryobacterales bacterium]|nr:DUF1080 domain-containing protein [Bryobacterales bacterium]
MSGARWNLRGTLAAAGLFLMVALSGIGPWAAAQSAAPPPAPKPRLSVEEQQAGWQLLFDGETTSGWKGVNTKEFPYDGWAVENGYLRTVKPGPSGDIVTTGEFRDFEFSFEWKIEEGGNSGVKYLVAEGRPEPNIPVISRNRLPRLGMLALGVAIGVYVLFWRRSLSKYVAVRVLAILVIMVCGYNLIKGARAYLDLMQALRHSAVGLEYQVLDDVGNPEPRSNPKASAASLYILAEADRTKELYGDDRFNQGRLVVQGNRVEHWLNGRKVLEYRLDDPAMAAAVAATKYAIVPGFLSREGGQLALQHHDNLVWFKNLKIRPLPAAEGDSAPAAAQ